VSQCLVNHAPGAGYAIAEIRVHMQIGARPPIGIGVSLLLTGGL
jgi:hypothetical protein